MIIFERYAHLKYKEEKNMYFLERPKNVTAIKSKFIAEIRKKAMRGGKSGSRSPAGQWDGSAAAALSRLLVGLFARGVRLASAPARGSARVTGRRQPPRKRSRRLVSKTSTRLALTPIYLPYINRISGVNGYFGAKTLRFTAIRKCLSGMPFKARKCR